MKHERVKQERPLLARRRVQFAAALVSGAVVPFLVRLLLPGQLLGAAVVNTFAANAAAITLAFWMRLSIEVYPGIRRAYVILPAALTCHAIALTWFVISRFPYDRIGLGLGFGLHVICLYLLFIYADRRVSAKIAIVPFGEVDRLQAIGDVRWVRLEKPELKTTRGCSAIVADFAADLPDEWEAFLADAALAGRIVFQVKQLAESLTGRVELERLSENSFGSLVPSRGYFYFKALLDFAFALALLPLVLLPMAVVAVAIRLDSDGPALFRQHRLGYAGRKITVYKFRTMRVHSNDEENDDTIRSALATDESDPRITRVGAVLRKFRIDELPQIFNILLGEMSWIGPRPEPEVLTHWFIAEIPFYRYRHVVKPGISGWAQVNQGYASGVDGINIKLQYDFYYIKYFSPWLDLLILLRTIKTMLTGRGAR